MPARPCAAPPAWSPAWLPAARCCWRPPWPAPRAWATPAPAACCGRSQPSWATWPTARRGCWCGCGFLRAAAARRRCTCQAAGLTTPHCRPRRAHRRRCCAPTGPPGAPCSMRRATRCNCCGGCSRPAMPRRAAMPSSRPTGSPSAARVCCRCPTASTLPAAARPACCSTAWPARPAGPAATARPRAPGHCSCCARRRCRWRSGCSRRCMPAVRCNGRRRPACWRCCRPRHPGPFPARPLPRPARGRWARNSASGRRPRSEKPSRPGCCWCCPPPRAAAMPHPTPHWPAPGTRPWPCSCHQAGPAARRRWKRPSPRRWRAPGPPSASARWPTPAGVMPRCAPGSAKAGPTSWPTAACCARACGPRTTTPTR